MSSAGVLTYLDSDALGSVIATTDSTGAVTNKSKYSPFGENAPVGTTFGYTGQRFDAETGLYYYKNRYYSPVLGRFLQTDPIGYGDGLNMYAYVGNDPVNLVDPLGLDSISQNSPTNFSIEVNNNPISVTPLYGFAPHTTTCSDNCQRKKKIEIRIEDGGLNGGVGGGGGGGGGTSSPPPRVTNLFYDPTPLWGPPIQAMVDNSARAALGKVLGATISLVAAKASLLNAPYPALLYRIYKIDGKFGITNKVGITDDFGTSTGVPSRVQKQLRHLGPGYDWEPLAQFPDEESARAVETKLIDYVFRNHPPDFWPGNRQR